MLNVLHMKRVSNYVELDSHVFCVEGDKIKG